MTSSYRIVTNLEDKIQKKFGIDTLSGAFVQGGIHRVDFSVPQKVAVNRQLSVFNSRIGGIYKAEAKLREANPASQSVVVLEDVLFFWPIICIKR